MPDVAPSEIAASRAIKVLLTGDLERPIYTNPFFFGQEKHYLRAQIARIIQSTTLMPAGLMKVNEEEDRVIEPVEGEDGEGVAAPTTAQMGKPHYWVHANCNILKNNTTKHNAPEQPEDAEDWDEEVELAKIKAADPFDARLKSIADDRKVRLTASV